LTSMLAVKVFWYLSIGWPSIIISLSIHRFHLLLRVGLEVMCLTVPDARSLIHSVYS